MDEKQIMKKLVRRARMEIPPQVDISNRVMTILRSREKQKSMAEIPLAWVAVLSAAIAVTVVLIAITSWQHWANPLLEILSEGIWRIL